MWKEPGIFFAFFFPKEMMYACQDTPSCPWLQVHSLIIVYTILSRRPPCLEGDILHFVQSIVHSFLTQALTIKQLSILLINGLRHRLYQQFNPPAPLGIINALLGQTSAFSSVEVVTSKCLVYFLFVIWGPLVTKLVLTLWFLIPFLIYESLPYTIIILSYQVNRPSVMSWPLFGEQNNRCCNKFNGICHLAPLESVCVVHIVKSQSLKRFGNCLFKASKCLHLQALEQLKGFTFLNRAGLSETPQAAFSIFYLWKFCTAFLLPACLTEFTFKTHCHHQEGKIWKTKVVCYPSALRPVCRGQETPGKASQGAEVSPRSQCQEKAQCKTGNNENTKGMHILHLSYIIYGQF